MATVIVNGITCGVTPQGFVRPTLNDIKIDLEEQFKSDFGAFINVLPQSVWGQMIGIQADRIDALWGVAQDEYNNSYPDTAFGASLDKAVSLNDVRRLLAKPTKIKNVNMTGTPGATVPLGKQAAVVGSGLTASLDAPVTFDLSGNAVGNFTATATGPLQFPSGQMTIIQTPSTGWLTVNNPTDGVLGRNVETDPQLKARRLKSLETSDAGPTEAIRNRILTVPGVTQCVIFENFYNIPDMSGRPPHSFQAYVLGGADQDIWDAIWLSKPGGIEPVGAVVGTTIDSQGQPQVMKFSRLIQKNVYGIATVTSDLTFPGDGDLQIKEAVVTYINTLIGGQELIITPNLVCTVDTIPGIQNISFKIGLAPSPTLSNNLIAAINEIFRSDTSLWSVVHI